MDPRKDLSCLVKLTQYAVPRDVQVLLFGRIILIDDDGILAFILVFDEDIQDSPKPSSSAARLVLFSHVPVTINERSATHLYMTVEVAGAFFDLSYVAIHP